MATAYWLKRDEEIAVQEETAYGVSPGALAGTDFFKATSGHEGFVSKLEELPRDRDHDKGQASVLEIQTGRKHTEISVSCDLIPSGVTGTPTPPDIDSLLKAIFGTSQTSVAHTTTTSGSMGTSLVLTAGGGAASGIGIGDLIAVDVSSTYGYEVRQVTNVSTDTITVDRAFSADPATGRAVKMGTTYRLSTTTLLSLYFWLFNADTLRYVVPGAMLNELALDINYADGVPLGKLGFKGMGQAEAAQSGTSRPSITTAGSPLGGAICKVFIGATQYRMVSGSLNIKNGNALRMNESHSMSPSGVKKTDNGSRFNVELSMDMLLTTGDLDVQTLYDGTKTLTARDVIVQIGDTVGNIVAFRCPVWKPRTPERSDIDGEVGIKLAGRCIGSAGNDEVSLAFL